MVVQPDLRRNRRDGGWEHEKCEEAEDRHIDARSKQARPVPHSDVPGVAARGRLPHWYNRIGAGCRRRVAPPSLARARTGENDRREKLVAPRR